ncbi:MAG TPA: ComF family protein [Bacillales bacterium]|nr:ComF family protein [Bacillales bacterium]
MASHCLWCDAEITEGVSWKEVFGLSRPDVLCRVCREGLMVLRKPLCRICGRSFLDLSSDYRNGDLCYDCIRWEEGEWGGLLVKNRSLYVYNEFLKEIVALFKFRGDAVVVRGFEWAWIQLYREVFSGTLVVPIPLSSERLYERGFNQAAELARLLPAPVCEVLERTVHEQKQSKKSRTERLHLEKPVFQYCGEAERIRGKDILLIDDIYTTGATVRRAAKVLLESEAASVSSMTIARG